MTAQVVVFGVTALTARCVELLLDEDCVIMAVVIPNADWEIAEQLRLIASAHEIPIAPVGALRDRYGLGIAVGFPQILPRETINLFARGISNLHLAPLPAYRGSLECLSAAIVNADTHFGVSLHLVDDGIDTGPVLTVREFPLPAEVTAGEALQLVLKEAAFLLQENLGPLLAGALEATPQAEICAKTGVVSEYVPRGSYRELMSYVLPVSTDTFMRHKRAVTWKTPVSIRTTTSDGDDVSKLLADTSILSRTELPEEASIVVGTSRTYFDPVWQVQVVLSDLEIALLQRPEIRRLSRIAHAGAASIYSAQTYSRLDHSLGLLAILSVLQPDDPIIRAAALVHDIGHAPLSHSLEPLMKDNHHVLGTKRIRGLFDLFATHGINVEDVFEALDGTSDAPLGRSGAMQPDHLESFVRSAHVQGRSRIWPRQLLDRIRIDRGHVAVDEATANYLLTLAEEESSRQTAPANVAANAAVQELVSAARLRGRGLRSSHLETMTDDDLWAHLKADDTLAPRTNLLLSKPEAWRAELISEDCGGDGAPGSYQINRLYLDPPLIDGELAPLPDSILRRRKALPLAYRIFSPPFVFGEE